MKLDQARKGARREHHHTRQLPRTAVPAAWHLHCVVTVWKEYHRVKSNSKVEPEMHKLLYE